MNGRRRNITRGRFRGQRRFHLAQRPAQYWVQIFLAGALAQSWNLIGAYAGQINLGTRHFSDWVL